MRQIELEIKFESPKYGIKIHNDVPNVGGLFLTEVSSHGHGPQIKMFPSLYQAQTMANSMNPDTVEIVEFVSVVDS